MWRPLSTVFAVARLLFPFVLSLQWVTSVVADGYMYDRCGGNNTLADKVHKDIPNPTRLGNLTTCALSANTYSAEYCIAAAVLIVIGGFFCFFGARFFKIILFLVGFLVAGGLVFFLMYSHLPCKTPHFSWVIIGVALGCGLLSGFFTVCLFTVGVFLIGAAVGALLMLSFLSFLNNRYVETHQWLPIVLIIVLAIIFGIIALKLEERLVAIPCTAFIGAVLTMYGLDYYVENGAAVQYSWLLMEGKSPHLKCDQTWVMLAGVWPLLLLAGLLIQCCKTGKKDKDDEEEEEERRGRRRRGWRKGSSSAMEERGELMRDIG